MGSLYAKNGLAFGLRDKQNGHVKAVVVFREYQPAKEITEFITMMRAYFQMKNDPLGVPKILQNDKTKRKKFEEASQSIQPMQEMMHDWHCQYAPNPEPHWYVGLVATDPDCQGKGYGKKDVATMTWTSLLALPDSTLLSPHRWMTGLNSFQVKAKKLLVSNEVNE